MAISKQEFEEFCTELFTLRDVLRWMVTHFDKNELFYGHGTDNAWDEALALLQHYLCLPINNLEQVLDSRLTGTEKEELCLLIEKRVNQRIPLPYITHEAWFNEMAFYVDENVLIPRSPFAELIGNNFAPWLDIDSKDHLNILEIGTGSGCIAVAIAEELLAQDKEVSVDASDISEKALAIAEQNINNYDLAEHVSLIKSDLFENIPDKKYDLIVSNPPYVDADEMAALPKEYLVEPQGALAAGHDGLELVDKMLAQAYNYLSDDGLLFVEVGASDQALEQKYPNVPFTWIEFANGGSGVFVLSKEELKQYFS